MENLIFSLNATVPVFLLMMLGLFFRKIGWVDEIFAGKMNQFVFMVPLPMLVFKDLATVDFQKAWNGKFVLFCFVTTVISIMIATAISLVWKDKLIQGEFIQASYRSSAALLGIALIQNIYGDVGMAPLMIIGSVPLYNVIAVVILTATGPDKGKASSGILKTTTKGIITNPIILGITAGIIWSLLRIQMPAVMEKTVDGLAGMATPMGLIAMGATLNMKKATGKIRPVLVAMFIKLIGFCLLFLPVAIWLGFRQEELVAILVMLGSATTVSCFVMARNMKHEGVLTSSVIMLTTLFSAFSLTGWLYLLKSMELL